MSFKQECKKKSFVYLHGLIHYIEPYISTAKNSKELIDSLIDAFKYYKYQKILLISSEDITDNQLLETLYKTGLTSNVNFISFPLKENQATTFQVEKALHEYISNQCQAILVIGDSVAIDLGKAVKARFLNLDLSIYQMRGFANIPHRKQQPLLFIMPLSLAGNESNLSSCILDHNHFEKIYLIDRLLSCDYIFYCPSSLTSLSADQFIGDICIALANALEALISKNATKYSRSTAAVSIKLILSALKNPIFSELQQFSQIENLIESEKNVKIQIYREKKHEFFSLLESLQEAANFSGKASAKCSTGYTQALRDALEVHYQIVDYKVTPLLFLAIVKMYQQKLSNSQEEIISNKENYQQLFQEISEALIKLIADWKLPQHLSFIRATDFDSIIHLVKKEMTDYYASPYELDKDNLSAILKSLQ